jgi:hypothetical protein
LEDANIKLGSVASDVLGKSGRAMLIAMIQGKEDCQQLADLAQGQLRLKDSTAGGSPAGPSPCHTSLPFATTVGAD